MRRTRRILMVAFVATALSADRAAAARLGAPGPTYRPPMAGAARRLAGRLMGTLRQTLASVRLRALPRRWARVDGVRRPATRPVDARLWFAPPLLDPFQFRLPPPAIASL